MSNGTSTILIIASMTGLLTLHATLFGRVFDSLRNEITSRLDSIEGRLTRLENKVDRLDVRIAELERFR
jgi:hypothetical protein